jgi:hypothetical protein
MLTAKHLSKIIDPNRRSNLSTPPSTSLSTSTTKSPPVRNSSSQILSSKLSSIPSFDPLTALLQIDPAQINTNITIAVTNIPPHTRQYHDLVKIESTTRIPSRPRAKKSVDEGWLSAKKSLNPPVLYVSWGLMGSETCGDQIDTISVPYPTGVDNPTVSTTGFRPVLMLSSLELNYEDMRKTLLFERDFTYKDMREL